MSSVGNYQDTLIHDNYQFFDDRVANNKDSFALDPETAQAIENGSGFSDDALPDGGSKTAGAFVARFAAEHGSDLYHGEGVETVIYEEAFSGFGPKYPELDLSGFANVVDIYGNGEGIDAMGITQAMTDGVLEIDLSGNNHSGLVDIHLDKVPYTAFLANISLQMEGKMPASVEDFVDLMSELSGDTFIGEPRDIVVNLLEENFGPDLDRTDMKAIFEENFIAIDHRSADLPIVNLIWSDHGAVLFDDTPGELIEQEYSLAEEDKVYSNMDFVQEGNVIDNQGNVTGGRAEDEGEAQPDSDAANAMTYYAADLVKDGTGLPKDAVVTNDQVSVEEWNVVVDLYGEGTKFFVTEPELALAIADGVVEVGTDGEIVNIELGKVTNETIVNAMYGEFGHDTDAPEEDGWIPIDKIPMVLARITGDPSIETPENVAFLVENFDDGTATTYEGILEIFSGGTITVDEASSDLDYVKLNLSEGDEATASTGDGSVTIGWKDLTAEDSDQVSKEGVTLLADYVWETASDIGTEAEVWASDVHQALLTIPGTTISLEDVQELGRISNPEGTATFTAESLYTLIDEGGIRFETDENGLVENASIDLSSVGADTDEE